MSKPKRIAILGSTGSIGRQGLEVVSSRPELTVCGLAARSSWRLLCEQARRYGPEMLALSDPAAAEGLRGCLGEEFGLLTGPDAAEQLIRRTRPDMILSGVVGSAGLAAALAGIETGSALAIANKETLVMAGAVVIPAARAAKVPVLPVDSEHSAIFQCLASGRREEVRRVVLTASGGALRDRDDRQVAEASVGEALQHPTWQMGPKITVDSATLINKALEIVEAYWLFDLDPAQIEVLIHPQSIVHSFVEFCDGSIIAQMGRPDMTTPIAYALSWPHRPPRPVEPLDLAAIGRLDFREPAGRFRRAIELGYHAIRLGGTAGAILNSANEAAVAAFLEEKIPFGRIVTLVEETLNRAPRNGDTTLQALREADRWARNAVAEAVESESWRPHAHKQT
jgi:1-deoxy-D-xylulose-5-phosphate reductoisomerase